MLEKIVLTAMAVVGVAAGVMGMKEAVTLHSCLLTVLGSLSLLILVIKINPALRRCHFYRVGARTSGNPSCKKVWELKACSEQDAIRRAMASCDENFFEPDTRWIAVKK